MVVNDRPDMARLDAVMGCRWLCPVSEHQDDPAVPCGTRESGRLPASPRRRRPHGVHGHHFVGFTGCDAGVHGREWPSAAAARARCPFPDRRRADRRALRDDRPARIAGRSAWSAALGPDSRRGQHCPAWPCPATQAAIWARETKRSLVRMCATWLATVGLLRYRRLAIAGFVSPSATSCATSISRPESGAAAPCCFGGRPPSPRTTSSARRACL